MSIPEPDRSVRPDCAEVVLRLFEYVDNEASPQDRAWIEGHLDTCSTCLREYECDRSVKSLVRRVCESDHAPASLRVQIMARITAVSVSTRRGT